MALEIRTTHWFYSMTEPGLKMQSLMSNILLPFLTLNCMVIDEQGGIYTFSHLITKKN